MAQRLARRNSRGLRMCFGFVNNSRLCIGLQLQAQKLLTITVKFR